MEPTGLAAFSLPLVAARPTLRLFFPLLPLRQNSFLGLTGPPMSFDQALKKPIKSNNKDNFLVVLWDPHVKSPITLLQPWLRSNPSIMIGSAGEFLQNVARYLLIFVVIAVNPLAYATEKVK